MSKIRGLDRKQIRKLVSPRLVTFKCVFGSGPPPFFFFFFFFFFFYEVDTKGPRKHAEDTSQM